jgi:type I restriction enzyme R subunit
MEHALRHHIKKKLDEDPVYYRRLSERLEDILHKFGDSWEQLEIILQAFVEEVRKGRTQAETPAGLDPELHAPFFDLLAEERGKLGPVTQADQTWLATLAIEMVERLIRDAVSNVGFWKSGARQDELRGHLFMFLDENDIVEFDDAEAVTERLMELAKANHGKLVRST